MQLESLQSLLASGEFHHATFRNRGTLWEGLWIYKKSPGARGFDVCGSFLKDSPQLESAYALVRGTGVSVGAYGQG